VSELDYGSYTIVVDFGGEHITADKIGRLFTDLEYYYDLIATTCTIADEPAEEYGDPATDIQRLLTFFFGLIQERNDDPVWRRSSITRRRGMIEPPPIEVRSLQMASPLTAFVTALTKPLDILFKVISPIERERRIEEVRALRVKNDHSQMKMYYEEVHNKVKTTEGLLKLRERLIKSKNLPDHVAAALSDNLDAQLADFIMSNSEEGILLLPPPQE